MHALKPRIGTEQSPRSPRGQVTIEDTLASARVLHRILPRARNDRRLAWFAFFFSGHRGDPYFEYIWERKGERVRWRRRWRREEGAPAGPEPAEAATAGHKTT